jgi:hypothetical protein
MSSGISISLEIRRIIEGGAEELVRPAPGPISDLRTCAWHRTAAEAHAAAAGSKILRDDQDSRRCDIREWGGTRCRNAAWYVAPGRP